MTVGGSEVTIVLTGGGSGGHITPLLAIASELKKEKPGIKLVYISQKGDNLADIPAKDSNIDQIFSVRAGKFRRYHGEGPWQFLNPLTVALNIRDAIYVKIGFLQSYLLFKKIRPDMIFSRGGYVSVPVCLAAKLRGVKYITHDSDPVPSLTNKIIGRWAELNLVSAPKEFYPYAPDKTINTGVPVSHKFELINAELRSKYRQKLNIGQKDKLLFVIGGGLGAQSINKAMVNIAPNLLTEFDDLRVVHIVGRGNEGSVLEDYDTLEPGKRERVEIISFTDKVYLYSGAADLIITRAGATNLAEFEIQGVPCIVIPSSFLVAGHQLKNAQILKDSQAVAIVDGQQLDKDPNILAKEVSRLLNNPKERHQLGLELAKMAHPKAGHEIASIILKTAEA